MKTNYQNILKKIPFPLLLIWLLAVGYGLAADGESGSLKWKFDTHGPILSSPVVTPEGIILVGSNDEHLYAIGPGGNIQWKYETGFWVQSTPAVSSNEVVCVGSWDHHLYAIKLDQTLQ